MFYVKKTKTLFSKHSKIVENYGFMTFLQISSSLISLIIYPYLIRVLGVENYGIYAFSFSIYTYFNVILAFGFHIPVVKELTLHQHDIQKRNEAVSLVYSAKFYLFIVACIILTLLLTTIPILKKYWIVILICYSQIIGEILFPVWYFQAIQKMKIVTFIRIIFRILSIPVIFILIKTPADYILYALIASITVILSGIAAVLYMSIKEGVRLKLYTPLKTKKLFSDSFPFFWNNLAVTLKEESITIILGAFISMKSVALYDLAKKIVLIPQLLLINLNKAIFPNVIQKITHELRRKILRFESLLGVGIILGIIIFGKWIALLLGGKEMLDAYPLAILLSFTLISWLIVESYNNYVFVPNNLYKHITINQSISLLIFTVLIISILYVYPNVLLLVGSLAFVGIFEIIYCVQITKRLDSAKKY